MKPEPFVDLRFGLKVKHFPENTVLTCSIKQSNTYELRETTWRLAGLGSCWPVLGCFSLLWCWPGYCVSKNCCATEKQQHEHHNKFIQGVSMRIEITFLNQLGHLLKRVLNNSPVGVSRKCDCLSPNQRGQRYCRRIRQISPSHQLCPLTCTDSRSKRWCLGCARLDPSLGTSAG